MHLQQQALVAAELQPAIDSFAHQPVTDDFERRPGNACVQRGATAAPLGAEHPLAELQRAFGHVQAQPRQAEAAGVDLPAQPLAAEAQVDLVQCDPAATDAGR